MEAWFNDEEIQDLLTKLMDRLCSLERMGGEVFGSTLIFWGNDIRYPVLFAREGKPFFPREHLSNLDVEMAVKMGLKQRLPK